jgi:hypothetical protein
MQASESRLFSFRSEFHRAVQELLVRSRLSIALADMDFSDWPLETPDAVAQVSRILQHPESGLRLVVHAPDWLEKYGARFAQLRRTFSGRIECRQAPPTVTAGEGLMLGDRLHLLRRAHYQSFRGRVTFAMPEEVDPWRHKFEALWQESTPCLTATTTGL